MADKIDWINFEQPKAGPEGASPKDGASKPECTWEYMKISSQRATPLWQAQQVLKHALKGRAWAPLPIRRGCRIASWYHAGPDCGDRMTRSGAEDRGA